MTCEIADLLAGPVAAAAGRAGLPWPPGSGVPLEPCRGPGRGDFSSLAAFRLAGLLPAGGPPPRRIGEEILGRLPAPGDLLARADLAGPGFLNLTVRHERWCRALADLRAPAGPPGRGEVAEALAADPAAAGEVGEALARIAGVRRARAAAGEPPGEISARALASLERPEERDLVRRAALLPEIAAAPARAPGVLEAALGAVARDFRAYDGAVRLVTADARGTRARLALAGAVERALSFGVRALRERR